MYNPVDRSRFIVSHRTISSPAGASGPSSIFSIFHAKRGPARDDTWPAWSRSTTNDKKQEEAWPQTVTDNPLTVFSTRNYRKLSLRKLEKVKIKKKNKEKSYYRGRIREVFEERGKL